MDKKLYLNIPVKDTHKALAFYTALGFEASKEFGNPISETVVFNDGVLLMLVKEDFFKESAKRTITNTAQAAEVVLATEVPTRKAVDEIVDKAQPAGGQEIGAAFEHDGMYTRIFRDLDGHQFNVFVFIND